MNPIQTARKFLTALILVLLVLPALPAPTVQATPLQASDPTTNCSGSGYMRQLNLPYTLNRSDDVPEGPFDLGFTLDFFGTNYSNVYINNNGVLTFGNSSGSYTPQGMSGLGYPAVAPFYADVDTRPTGNPNLAYYGQVTVNGRPAFAVHWSQVGYFSQHLDKINDFQVILIDRSDRAVGDWDIEFNYAQIQWETGDASGGSGGLGGSSAAIGYADGSAGTNDYQAFGSLVPGSFLDSNWATGAVHTSVNSPNCGQWIFPVELGTPPNLERWTVTSLDSIGCDSNDTEFTMELTNVTFPNNLWMRTLVNAGDTRYMDETFDMPQDWSNGPQHWELYFENSGGTATDAWPIPSYTPIIVQFLLLDGPGGSPVTISEAFLSQCNGGTLMSNFADVPANYWAGSWIYRLYAAGITQGCSTSPFTYCPENPVTRAQMAIFLERGMRGHDYIPPNGTGSIFTDVSLSYWAVNWIEKLYADGITQGCSASPLSYCPENSVTRAQMAVFLLRAKYGATYIPPAATGIFADVSTGYWAARWIERLYAEGITSGCATSPLSYCPESPVTRAQMAVFLVRTFALP